MNKQFAVYLIAFFVALPLSAQVGVRLPVNIPVGDFSRVAYPTPGVGLGMGVGVGSMLRLHGGFNLFPHLTHSEADRIGHLDLFELSFKTYVGPKLGETKGRFSARGVLGYSRVWNDFPRLYDPSMGPVWSNAFMYGLDTAFAINEKTFIQAELGHQFIYLDEPNKNMSSIRLTIGGSVQLGK